MKHDFRRIPESTIALCLNHSDGRRKSVTRGYIKPSAAVLKARDLSKVAAASLEPLEAQ
jgi:hypothetical protein